MLRPMKKLFNGASGFLICLLVGIIFDQVALGIIAGMFLGAILGARTSKTPPEDNPNA